MQQSRLSVRIAGDVQVGAADVPDQQRVAAEQKPGLLVAAPPIRHRVRKVRRRVTGRGDRRHDCVSQLDDVSIGECNMLEGDSGFSREVADGARALDERRQPGDVVGLHVRLEHGRDWCADGCGGREVLVDEIDVWIDNGQLADGGAAEQVAGAGTGVVEERSQDHLVSSQTVDATGRPARRHSG
jgi:hypothetical protein